MSKLVCLIKNKFIISEEFLVSSIGYGKFLSRVLLEKDVYCYNGMKYGVLGLFSLSVVFVIVYNGVKVDFYVFSRLDDGFELLFVVSWDNVVFDKINDDFELLLYC